MNKKPQTKESPQISLNKMMNLYYENRPFVKTDINHELEVKFSTKTSKMLTSIDYENVISKFKSLGFTAKNSSGDYFLRIYSEFMDVKTGSSKMSSNLRTEIDGLHSIQEYCKINNVKKMIQEPLFQNTIRIMDKSSMMTTEQSFLPDVVFADFNFSVSYKKERTVRFTDRLALGILNDWDNNKKTFRFLNRVTFVHPDYPVLVDISIVKSSGKEKLGGGLKKTYNIQDSGVLNNPEMIEIELELNNSLIGPGTPFNNPEKIEESLRKVIKYVLCGLQGSNYPIGLNEQQQVLRSYMTLLHGKNSTMLEKRIYPNDFIGPSSFTLLTQNIVLQETSNSTTVPNIRENYVVTEKADGQRSLMFISEKGRIYLININMSVIFTGAMTENTLCMNSLLDGELILRNKFNQYVCLYAGFDAYYMGGKDIRAYPFIHSTKTKEKETRYHLLKTIMTQLNMKSVVSPEEKAPIRILAKEFYPLSLTGGQEIFKACDAILQKTRDHLYEYNTDGLIFTPSLLGVGSNQAGKAGPLSKVNWEHSFKWKPPEYNTIDFLVTTVKNQEEQELVTPIFQDGTNMMNVTQFNQYKTLILQVGFNEKTHGYIHPCQDIVNGDLPSVQGKESEGGIDDENTYKNQRFYPTQPYDPDAGICRIMLKPDGNGNMQMKTEEDEVFYTNTIVEFKYDLTRERLWRWVPLRVRYDKTSQLKQSLLGLGKPNYGNAYHVANPIWQTIHNPITETMITTGNNIPSVVETDDVYYNRVTNAINNTQSLRDFHNLYVKQKLLSSVSKPSDTLIDLACGKGGDLPKWISAHLSFVFGVDVALDNLENRLDGACARYLNYCKKYRQLPDALFVNGDSRYNIKNGSAMLNDKAKQIIKAIMGEGPKTETLLGKGVFKQYGKAKDGFQICSCQFAMHYFMENLNTFQSYMRNLAEMTKLNGYYLATCYQGREVFQLLKNKKQGEQIEIVERGQKIFAIEKQYSETTFEPDSSSLGYKINVFQESINKTIAEYLVNFDYVERVMEDYGFVPLTPIECKELGLPNSSGSFSELYRDMQTEIKANKYRNKYGLAERMTANEKKISFLNGFMVYKKIRNVNALNIVLETTDEPLDLDVKETNEAVKISIQETKKPNVKRLKKKLILIPATEVTQEEN